MTPAELQACIDGKMKIRNMYRTSLVRHMDRIQASQTANLMYMQGRTMEKPIDPETCMTFAWDKQKSRQPITEMTEEDMTRFDQNMDTWGGVRKHG
jgi:hypothetical protein